MMTGIIQLVLIDLLKMKQILITMLLLLGAAGSVPASAQSTWGTVSDDQYKSEVRQKLNLDYSMPDYTTHKIDSKLMGPRLATILQELCAKYKQDGLLSTLSMIQCDQVEGLDYCTIEKMNLDSVSKMGNTITICYKTTLAKNPLDLKKSDLIMTFIDGVSENKQVNSLFSNICNYMK